MLLGLLSGRRQFALLTPPTDEEAAATRAQDAEDRQFGDVVAPFRGTPYTCPCCGHPTLPERGAYDTCDECGWEDDGQDEVDSHILRRTGPNGLSLDEARTRYVASGSLRGHHVPP